MAPKAKAEDSHIAWPGVLRVSLTFLPRLDNGIPLSRASAKMMRETEVKAAKPQNHIAKIVNPSTAPTARSPSDVRTIVKTAGIGFPPESLAVRMPPTFGMAQVRESIRRYPKTPETATDVTIPQGARRRGSIVSSATCAEASKPVYVHCACNSPSTNNQAYGARIGLKCARDHRN